jgi:hypothetical protein
MRMFIVYFSVRSLAVDVCFVIDVATSFAAPSVHKIRNRMLPRADWINRQVILGKIFLKRISGSM